MTDAPFFTDLKAELNNKDLDKRVAHTPRMTERKVHQVMADRKLKDQFRDTEKLVFQAELELLIGEYRRHELVFAVNIDKETGTAARYVGEFVEQNEELILTELQKRLHLPLGVIQQYLENMSNSLRARFALEELINPFTGESVGFSAVELQPKKRRGERGKSKKNKKPSQGRKRPVMGYESIAAANKATGLGYRFLQYHADKKKDFI